MKKERTKVNERPVYLYSSGVSMVSTGRNLPVPRERLRASAATQAA